MFPYLPGTVLQKLDKQICLIYNMYKLFSNAICYKHVYTPLLSTGIPGRYFYLLGNLGSFESIQQPFYIFLCLAMKFKCYPFLFVSHIPSFCLSMGLIWDQFDFFSRVMTLKFLLYFERRFPLWLFICDNYIIMYLYIILI